MRRCILIVSHTRLQAEMFAREIGLVPEQWTYVSFRDQFYGLERVLVLLLKGWDRKLHTHELTAYRYHFEELKRRHSVVVELPESDSLIT